MGQHRQTIRRLAGQLKKLVPSSLDGGTVDCSHNMWVSYCGYEASELHTRCGLSLVFTGARLPAAPGMELLHIVERCTTRITR